MNWKKTGDGRKHGGQLAVESDVAQQLSRK